MAYFPYFKMELKVEFCFEWWGHLVNTLIVEFCCRNEGHEAKRAVGRLFLTWFLFMWPLCMPTTQMLHWDFPLHNQHWESELGGSSHSIAGWLCSTLATKVHCSVCPKLRLIVGLGLSKSMQCDDTKCNTRLEKTPSQKRVYTF